MCTYFIGHYDSKSKTNKQPFSMGKLASFSRIPGTIVHLNQDQIIYIYFYICPSSRYLFMVCTHVVYMHVKYTVWWFEWTFNIQHSTLNKKNMQEIQQIINSLFFLHGLCQNLFCFNHFRVIFIHFVWTKNIQKAV